MNKAQKLLSVAGAAAALFSVLPVFGLSLVPAAVFSGMLVILVLWQRWNIALATATGILLTVWLLTASQYVIALLKLNGIVYFSLFWFVLSMVALLYLWNRSEVLKKTTTAHSLVWLMPGVVGIIWLGAFFLNVWGLTKVGLTWAMSGDAPTFVTQARDIANLGGNEIWNNAVPVPPALAAVAMISGRDASLVAPTLQHDVTSFALVWAMGIALTSWAFGAVVVSLLKTRALSRWVLNIVGFGASIIPMTWMYSGYATWYGFFNSTIALGVLLLIVLAFIAGRDHPLALLGLYFFAATTMFLVWSPLVVVPVALGAFVFFTNIRSLWKASTSDKVFALVGLIQLLGFALWQALPLLVATQGTSVPGSALLALNGAAIYFRPLYIAGIFAGTVVALFLALWRKQRELLWGLLTLVLSLVAGFAYMVYGSGTFTFPWLYYPSKFIWIAILVLIPIALGSALAWILQFVKNSLFMLVTLAVVALLSFGFIKATAAWGHINAGTETPTIFHQLLVERDVTGIDQTADREVAEEIFALEKQDHLRMLWQSGNQWEDQINFWMLKMWSISDHGALMLGDFTYGVKERNLENLCEVLIEVRTPVELVTQNKNLAEELAVNCPDVSPIVTQLENYRP